MNDCEHKHEGQAILDDKHVYVCRDCGRTRPDEGFAPFGAGVESR